MDYGFKMINCQIECPCRNCKDRYPCCHDDCKDYEKYKNEIDAVKKEARHQEELDLYAKHITRKKHKK